MPKFKVSKTDYTAVSGKPSGFVDKTMTELDVKLDYIDDTSNDQYANVQHKNANIDTPYIQGKDMLIWLAKEGGALPKTWTGEAESKDVDLTTFSVNIKKGQYSVVK